MRYWLASLCLVGASLFVACYSPNLSSPGYYCDPANDPPCPDGQQCVNGRCMSKRKGNNNNNGDEDLAGQGPVDMKGTDIKKGDMAQQAGAGSCGVYVQCLMSCTSTACYDGCDAKIDSDGQTKFNAAAQCIYDYCVNFAADCEFDDFTQSYVDAFGKPTGSCDDCLYNAATGFTGNDCTDTTDCAPSVCKSSADACLNDT